MSFMSQARFVFCLLLEEIILLNNDLPCARTSIFKTVRGAAHLLMSFLTDYELTSRTFFTSLLLQKDSLQMPKSAVRCRKQQNHSGDVALQDELNVSMFLRSPRETSPNQEPAPGLEDHTLHFLTASAACLLSSQWLKFSHVKAQSSRTVYPDIARLNRTKWHGALGWWLSPERESLSYALGVP